MRPCVPFQMCRSTSLFLRRVAVPYEHRLTRRTLCLHSASIIPAYHYIHCIPIFLMHNLFCIRILLCSFFYYVFALLFPPASAAPSSHLCIYLYICICNIYTYIYSVSMARYRPSRATYQDPLPVCLRAPYICTYTYVYITVFRS